MTNYRYQVKWEKDGKTHYGLYVTPSLVHEAEYLRNKVPAGHALVEDAVLACNHIVPEADLVDIPHGFPSELDKHVEAEFQKAQAASDVATTLVGKLFSVGVADGSAWYVVTKVTKRTATVEWRGFCPDRWTSEVFGYGGSFPLATIKRLVESREAIKRLFSKQPVMA